MAQSSVTSNETFTYKQAMHEKDYHKLVKAMIKELTIMKTKIIGLLCIVAMWIWLQKLS
jgi:hypothetical protein